MIKSYCQFVPSSVSYAAYAKYYVNWFTVGKVNPKLKRHFFETQCTNLVTDFTAMRLCIWTCEIVCASILFSSWHGSWRIWFPTCRRTSNCWCNVNCTWRRRHATAKHSQLCTRNDVSQSTLVILLQMQCQWDVPAKMSSPVITLLCETVKPRRAFLPNFWCCELFQCYFSYPTFFYKDFTVDKLASIMIYCYAAVCAAVKLILFVCWHLSWQKFVW